MTTRRPPWANTTPEEAPGAAQCRCLSRRGIAPPPVDCLEPATGASTGPGPGPPCAREGHPYGARRGERCARGIAGPARSLRSLPPGAPDRRREGRGAGLLRAPLPGVRARRPTRGRCHVGDVSHEERRQRAPLSLTWGGGAWVKLSVVFLCKPDLPWPAQLPYRTPSAP